MKERVCGLLTTQKFLVLEIVGVGYSIVFVIFVIVEVARILLGKAGSRAGCSNLDNISLCLRLIYILAFLTLLACTYYLLIIFIVILACIHLVILDW